MKRPPIVVIMGHVDHGKTTLLDYIKKTNLAAKEAGGITQSIGAYEILHNDSKITFIDTPGHEAFSKMRARGSKIADIAILVVAADEGVKPQTIESYKIAEKSKTPIIVAITKTDKPNADINKVKGELSQAGVLLEGFGGSVSWHSVSVKTGEGINELLDLILLAAEFEDLSYNPESPAAGFVLESKLDNKKGVVATLIITDGILKVGDRITAGVQTAKIRSMESFLGKQIDNAEPSAPILVLGFSNVPDIGINFSAGDGAPTEQPKEEAIVSKDSALATEALEGNSALNLFLKSNDSGSLEALAEIIKNLPKPDNYAINIIGQSVGDISDGDVKSVLGINTIIVGFKVKLNKAAENLIKIHGKEKVEVITSDIIYELVKALEEKLDSLKLSKIIGDLEVLAVFGKKGGKQIIGGKVKDGEVTNGKSCDILRGEDDIGRCKIVNLQKNKQDVVKVGAGSECGLLVSADAEIKAGDHIIIRSK